MADTPAAPRGLYAIGSAGLTIEALVVLLAIPAVTTSQRGHVSGFDVGYLVALFVLLVSATAMLRRRGGKVLSCVVQVLAIGAGVASWPMYVDYVRVWQQGAASAAVPAPAVASFSLDSAVVGDHITNDISLGLRIPMAKAERLKVEEGSVILGSSRPGESIVLKDETGFAGKEVEREMLNTIIHCRVREAFELLKKATTCDPTQAPAHYQLSRIYSRRGESAAADQEMRLFLKYRLPSTKGMMSGINP